MGITMEYGHPLTTLHYMDSGNVEFPIGKTNTPLWKEFPLSPIKKFASMSRILCSRGSSSVSFCCSGSSALSDSGCCCCSGSPPLFGSRCPASAPASGSPLASVSLDVLLRLLQSTLHQLPFAVAHPYPSWNLLPTALHH